MFREMTKFRQMLYLTLGVLTGAVVGCNAPLPTASDSTPTTTVVGQVGSDLKGRGKLGDGGSLGSLSCADSGSVSKNIGTGGGTISLGGVTLSIPSHSLRKLTKIVLVPIPGAGPQVQFFPEGLVFNPDKLPRLTMNTDCIGNPVHPVIVYTNDAGKILETERSYPDKHSVWADIKHFSRYAVAW